MAIIAVEMNAMRDVTRVPVPEEMTRIFSERLAYFHRIAKRKLNNGADAEDAVQDAFLSAWRHLDQFHGHAQISTWLTTIVINSARMILRKRRWLEQYPVERSGENEGYSDYLKVLPDSSRDPEAAASRGELEHRLRQLSACLHPALRGVLELRAIEGLSIRETAAVLGLTESAVKSRAARARTELSRLHERSWRCRKSR
jgi:RNA polymerase sigma-70 factor, ECF subfamily